MSDFSIPGVSNKYQSSEMIKAIMDAERIPLNRLEERKEEYTLQRSIWQQMNRTIDRFRDSSRKLYSFQNPFQSLIASSSQERALTANASRSASRGTSSIEVLQTAAGDRFATRSLPDDYRVPQGLYRFRVGDDEVSINFRGGTLDAFSRMINQRGTGILTSSVVRDTFDTRVLVIGSLKTGEENRLFFDDSAKELAVAMGMLEEKVDTSFSEAPEKLVNPGKEASIPINRRLSGSEQLTIRYSVENLPRDEHITPDPPPGPSIEAPEGVSMEDITIQSSPSNVELPSWEPPPPPPFQESRTVFSIGDRALPDIDDRSRESTMVITADQISGMLGNLIIDNSDNTHRRITVHDLSIQDPAERGDAIPARPVSTASDAIIRIDGIEVRRPDNEIDDVIPGVSLNVRGVSDGPVELAVEPDREAIKEDIIAFVGSYNQLVTRINILTDRNEAVIDEIEYFSDEEREAAREQQGLFQGDTTFMQLKNRLQQMITAPYQTSEDNRLSMLSQIGISSNSAGFGGGVDSRRLRGYLEINEGRLDEALESDLLPAIRELFGRDSSGDLLVDSGLAYELDQYTSFYTSTGGLIATRISGINQRIERTDNEIGRMEVSLERKEQQLRNQYGQMEGALERLEESGRSLENLNQPRQ
jgi:flagellar hook-associated protein 2